MHKNLADFLDKATVSMLKSKLSELGEQTSGNKAALLLRLEEATRNLPNNEIERIFAENALASESATISSENGASGSTNNDDLDAELSRWREMLQKKKEIEELKRQLAELNDDNNATNVPVSFHFRDIEESIHPFSGDDKYSVHKWINQIEETAEILGWNERACFVYARRLTTGTAKLFLRTIAVKSWNELKEVFIREFERKVTNADVHNELRNRKRKANETWQQYMFSMQEIAASGNIDDSDLIQYIINGINDSSVNKMILYNADTITELKHALQKYDKIKTSQNNNNNNSHRNQYPEKNKKNKFQLKCFNCNEVGHVINKCPHPRREKGSCYRCGKLGHRIQDCKEKEKPICAVDDSSHHTADDFINNFEKNIMYQFSDDLQMFKCDLLTLLDSGSPISFVQQQFLPACVVKGVQSDKYKFHGINNSNLQIIGLAKCKIYFCNSNYDLDLYVVKNYSMSYPVILGRNFMRICNLHLSKEINKNDKGENQDKNKENKMVVDETTYVDDESPGTLNEFENDNFLKEILCINVANEQNFKENININSNLPYKIMQKAEQIVKSAWSYGSNKDRSCIPKIDFEMEIRVTTDKPFYCTPRRLPYAHKLELEKILDDLLRRKVIRESNSPYASPIVLVQKKNKELRLCVDYRELNKITVRENFPLPLIEDHLDRLKDKKYFSILDLKQGFHHVKISENSIKYTAFITPVGQFEYLRMPFGLKNAPAVFEKYMKKIFKPLISSGKVLSYIDDILIATESIDEHIEILEKVMEIINDNCLELRFDKCSFFQEEIVYLGYKINSKGIQPNEENLKAIKEFPIPNCIKSVRSFLGLCSYFRKFIKDFATIAKPLYDLLKKDASFVFSETELETFENLKAKLLDAPVLSIYNPHAETQLHCDASTVGYGSILMQKQKDGKFHPVAYFSKRATESERKYHSYELETLSIIYALRRFRVYLIGLKFKVITDCQSLALTLNKKFINPRISRWALELQDFDFTVEHRSGNRMMHADALSRSMNILNVTDESFEYVLAASQRQDPVIAAIASELEKHESPLYEMVDGLIYRKIKGQIRFYVPSAMVNRVIQTHHDAMCHLGVDKVYELLSRTYWFPFMKQRIKDYVRTCLKCAYFSPNSGRIEGSLHSIPKGRIPFDTIHIDHFGPLARSNSKKCHVFLVIDGFTKFVKLYSVKSTDSKEAINCLKTYFEYYSRPNKIISDRGTCFTSQEFTEFLKENNIKHIKIATATPQANGQVERVNRVLTTMLAKECEPDTTANWDKHLAKVEFALNNTFNRSTGFSPSLLLFGVNQKGEVVDKVAEFIQSMLENSEEVDLLHNRAQADKNIKKSQEYAKIRYDNTHKEPHIYKPGDYVMLKNNVVVPGVNKKLFARYRGPYEIDKVLENDRYIVKDLDGMQISRIPYRGVCSVANMKPYIISPDISSST